MIFMVGALAGVLCTISFIPQVRKIFREKQTKDLSLVTFVMLNLGVLLWLIYGLMIEELPIIISNAVIFILSLVIIFQKIKHG